MPTILTLPQGRRKSQIHTWEHAERHREESDSRLGPQTGFMRKQCLPGVRMSNSIYASHCSLGSIRVRQWDFVFFNQSQSHIGCICSSFSPSEASEWSSSDRFILLGSIYSHPFPSFFDKWGTCEVLYFFFFLGAGCPSQMVFLLMPLPWW